MFKLAIASWVLVCFPTITGLIRYSDLSVAVFAAVLIAVSLSLCIIYVLVGRSDTERSIRSLAARLSTRDCFGVAVGTYCLVITGNLFLLAAYAKAGVFQASLDIQAIYAEAVLGEMPSTGLLGSVGHLLRSLSVFPLVMTLLFLRVAEPRLFVRKALLLGLLTLMIVLSYQASFSRGSVLFQVVCMFAALHIVGYKRATVAKVGLATAAVGVVFFALSSAQRDAALGRQDAEIASVLASLFAFEPSPFTDMVTDHFGVGVLGLLLYLSHSIPECIRLVSAGVSPHWLGAFVFFPVINPAARLFGLEIKTDQFDLERPGVWSSVIGELYLDFGLWAFLIYPLIVSVMCILARRFMRHGYLGLAFYVTTAVFFCLFPLYSAFHSFGVTYFLLLTLLIGRSAMRQLLRGAAINGRRSGALGGLSGTKPRRSQDDATY